MLGEGREMVMPGDNLTIEVDLIAPVAMNQGLKFAIREGGRTVGAGQVTEIHTKNSLIIQEVWSRILAPHFLLL